tara:strand:+ start:477 stop:1604 length:1128 start_codon:yes stop_codon:yes gene_type:complete
MLSRLNFFLSIVVLYLITNLAHAHSIKPSIVEYRIFGKNIELNLSINAEVFLSGIDASKFIDTANAPQVKLYDELRKLQIDELESKIRDSIDSLKDSVYLKVDQKMLSLNLDEINVQDVEDEENIRITIISFKTTAPEDGKTITFAWKKELGSLIFRDFSMEIDNDGKASTKWLKAGEKTAPIPLADRKSNMATIIFPAIQQGIKHIIPGGLDHILFVLGLFFFSYKIGPLLSQVTIFTIAHSITLILGSLGYIYLPPVFVEAIIAASIVWIGLENVVRTKLNISRIGIIFCFGLLHGLGFAYMFTQIGLEGSDYLINLFSFNLGVEVGQLLVLTPFILITPILSRISWYRVAVSIPASIIIALFGVKMFIERVL